MPYGPTSGRARLSVIVALSLVLLTGLMLGQLDLLGSAIIGNAPATATRATLDGAAFYAAIDTYIATGQSGAVRALLRPDFIDHIDDGTKMLGFDPLLRRLDDIRAFFPESRFDAQPLSARGDIVHFAITLVSAKAGTVAGLPIAATGPIVASETLRTFEGRIVERWGGIQLPVANTPIVSIAWDLPPASQLLPAIQMVTMLAGSR